jgi:hypothetical protein
MNEKPVSHPKKMISYDGFMLNFHLGELSYLIVNEFGINCKLPILIPRYFMLSFLQPESEQEWINDHWT